jgi:hypothetical protein
MCLICVELAKNTMTVIEARKNLGEIKSTISREHILEVYQMISDKEMREDDYHAVMAENEYYGDSD